MWVAGTNRVWALLNALIHRNPCKVFSVHDSFILSLTLSFGYFGTHYSSTSTCFQATISHRTMYALWSARNFQLLEMYVIRLWHRITWDRNAQLHHCWNSMTQEWIIYQQFTYMKKAMRTLQLFLFGYSIDLQWLLSKWG